MERLSTDPAARRRLAVHTVVLGAAFVVEAAVTIAFAVTLPTTTFLIASRVVRWAVGAVVVLFTVWQFGLRRASRAASLAPARAVAGPARGGDGVARRRSTPWLVRRSSGFGLRPQTWQARVVVAVVIAAVVAARLALFHA